MKQIAWDDHDVYLFDIDGTLLNCNDAVHYFAFCNALSTLVGHPTNLDGVMTQGNTDVGILRDALQLAGLPEEHWRPKLDGARETMRRSVQENADDFAIVVLPAVKDLLTLLKTKGKVLGVATGNLEEIGRTKLDRCGLLPFFDFGGYSDEHEYRIDVFAEAVEKAKALAGEESRICVVGDTPEDIKAARANGLNVIAVATGTFDYETLLREQPDWCLRSLEELLTP